LTLQNLPQAAQTLTNKIYSLWRDDAIFLRSRRTAAPAMRYPIRIMAEKRRIRIDFQYIGSAYAGWQWQDNALAIQQVAEAALEKLVNHKARLNASGRTDSGVHALCQPAHADVSTRMDDLQILRGLNAVLPKDVCALDVRTVPDGWDAREHAKRKTYQYTILNRETPSVFMLGRAWHIHSPLDLEAMRSAATHLLGEKDFSSFRSSGHGGESPIRNVLDIRMWRQMAADEAAGAVSSPPEGSIIQISFVSTGFLKQMVRNMVGTLVDVGRGKAAPDAIPAILAARDRTSAGVCAPAEGLYLMRVEY